MPDIISVINQKGGVGKTTTAHNLGSALMKKGFKILFLDLDAQCNLTSGFTAAPPETLSSFDILTEPQNAPAAVLSTPAGDIIPASPALSGADTAITAVGKEYRLKEALDSRFGEYDAIIIDTPPALGILTANALTASGDIIIPAGADAYSLQGISGLHSTIETIRKYCNPNLKIKGILLTRFNSRAVLSRDIAEILDKTAQTLGTVLFKTRIRDGIAVKEAQANQMSVLDYAPKSNPALDYIDFCDELLEMF